MQMSYTDQGLKALREYLGYDDQFDPRAKELGEKKLLKLSEGLEAFMKANSTHFLSPKKDRRCLDRVKGLATDYKAVSWHNERRDRLIHAMFECLKVHHYCHDIRKPKDREVHIADMIRMV